VGVGELGLAGTLTDCRNVSPRACEVLHDGRWIAGWLLHWYRDPRDGRWRGVVQYTVAPGATYYQPRDQTELRPIG
jgi:hypothetical protein